MPSRAYSFCPCFTGFHFEVCKNARKVRTSKWRMAKYTDSKRIRSEKRPVEQKNRLPESWNWGRMTEHSLQLSPIHSSEPSHQSSWSGILHILGCLYIRNFLPMPFNLASRSQNGDGSFQQVFTLTCAALKLEIASRAEAVQLSQCHESGRGPVMFWCISWDPTFNSCQSRLLEVYISTSWHVLEKTHCCGNVLLTKTWSQRPAFRVMKRFAQQCLADAESLHLQCIKCCSAAGRTRSIGAWSGWLQQPCHTTATSHRRLETWMRLSSLTTPTGTAIATHVTHLNGSSCRLLQHGLVRIKCQR